MRTFLCVLGFAAALLGAAPAHAQFANRSLGLSGGYISFNRTAGLQGGAFVGVDASLYIESGFELVSLTKIAFPLDPATNKRVIGLAPSLGLRYLFLEESVRPYVGADLSYLLVFKEATTPQYVGLGPNAGVEFFISESVALGARAQYNFYIALNEETQTSVILGAGVSAYF
jgi:outer membrane protein